METSPLIIDTRKIISEQEDRLTAKGYTSFLLRHFGEINQDLIHSFSETVEDLLISAGEKKPLVKRIFSILIEGLQNVLIHGERVNGDQLASVIVAANPEKYAVVIGNLTETGGEEKLKTYIDNLNEMTEESVKEFYLEVLNNGLISEKGGAGLGFITMRMKSKSALYSSFGKISPELSFFTVGSVIER